jgi:RNA polymerase sigma-70 factor (ECF subfamily)
MNPQTGPTPYPSQGASAGPSGVPPGAGADDAEEESRRLLERMRRGDETALGALYDLWSPRLHPLILHVVGGSAEDAEEVLEETFWQAWRQADRYDGGRGRVGAWLATMARSRALDRARARSRVREDGWDEVPRLAGGAAADAPDPLHRAAAAEERGMVRGALMRLPVEQREALELAYYGGLSQTEIAERTGQPLGTVKTRIRLALQKLRDSLTLLREDPR